jgi:hypothetical protein
MARIASQTPPPSANGHGFFSSRRRRGGFEGLGRIGVHHPVQDAVGGAGLAWNQPRDQVYASLGDGLLNSVQSVAGSRNLAAGPCFGKAARGLLLRCRPSRDSVDTVSPSMAEHESQGF